MITFHQGSMLQKQIATSNRRSSRDLGQSCPLLDYKRTQLIGLLIIFWLALDNFDLLPCAELLGHLGSATITCGWARVSFCWSPESLAFPSCGPLPQDKKQELITIAPLVERLVSLGNYRLHSSSVWTPCSSGRAAGLTRQLPPSLVKCLDSLLVARDITILLWRSKQQFSITDSVCVLELQFLHDYLLVTGCKLVGSPHRPRGAPFAYFQPPVQVVTLANLVVVPSAEQAATYFLVLVYFRYPSMPRLAGLKVLIRRRPAGRPPAVHFIIILICYGVSN
jgi:hypothetical protein